VDGNDFSDLAIRKSDASQRLPKLAPLPSLQLIPTRSARQQLLWDLGKAVNDDHDLMLRAGYDKIVGVA
jgi:hypothetical protein